MSDRARQALLDLLRDEWPAAEALTAGLRAVRAAEGVDAFALALRQVAGLEAAEDEAEALFARILAHREALRSQLDRDPGIRVAAADFGRDAAGGPTAPPETAMAAFDCAVEYEVRRARRHGMGFSILLVEIADWNAVRASRGLLYADELGGAAARTVRRAMREADRAWNLGAGRMAALLPGTERAGAKVVAERVLAALAAAARAGLHPEGRALRVHAGIGCWPEDGHSAGTVQERARAALQRAVRCGSSQVAAHHAERRGWERRAIAPGEAAQVAALPEGHRLAAEVENVSRSGILLEVAAPYPASQPVRVAFGGRKAWTRDGRVVRAERCRETPGMFRVGIAFDALAPLDGDDDGAAAGLPS
jgi:diguanylate cyclase (GGDEF)-like protein